jgi:hypothetical protein
LIICRNLQIESDQRPAISDQRSAIGNASGLEAGDWELASFAVFAMSSGDMVRQRANEWGPNRGRADILPRH